LPLVKKIAEENKNWELKLILRDEYPELMTHFMTGESQSIPIFLFIEKYEKLLFQWGPRPKAAQNIFEEHRELIMQGEILKQDVIKKIRRFYAKDKGQASLSELRQLFGKYID
jgi:predicted Rossmann-fold nucleotide-binding protein